MHFEIIVEDQSGGNALEILIPKILGNKHTFNIHSYKGIGNKIPKSYRSATDPSKRLLLDQLPRLLQGYGRTFSGYGSEYRAAVIIVCDLDRRCLKDFRCELHRVLNACNPRPETRFCIAIEEIEAWFLGDISAVKTAYPDAKDSVLSNYVQDSICNTWEKLADAIFPGGSSMLSSKGWYTTGEQKSIWAKAICPHMNPTSNRSPSFKYFYKKLKSYLVRKNLEEGPSLRPRK